MIINASVKDKKTKKVIRSIQFSYDLGLDNLNGANGKERLTAYVAKRGETAAVNKALDGDVISLQGLARKMMIAQNEAGGQKFSDKQIIAGMATAELSDGAGKQIDPVKRMERLVKMLPGLTAEQKAEVRASLDQ